MLRSVKVDPREAPAMTLVEFLTARLADRKAKALAVKAAARHEGMIDMMDWNLRDIEAKRDRVRLVAEGAPFVEVEGRPVPSARYVQILAHTHSDHPDYEEAVRS